jgi:hypothetical protein
MLAATNRAEVQMSSDLKPNTAELSFLNLAYNRFYDIFAEVMTDAFWQKDGWYRFSRAKDGFAIYAELLHYEPIKWDLEELKKSRPPMEAEIAGDLFRFIRNVVLHFPFFESWDQVWISKQIVNWCSEGKSIDQFLRSYAGKGPVKYRFWQSDNKRMTYLSITFPPEYSDDSRVFLKDVLTEAEGVKFAFILMRQVLDTQVIK